MPEQYHPPNVNQPRVLNRWLDVNSQNGPISRTGTFFIVPAFSITVLENLVPYIYGRFLFSAPKNFSIIQLPDLSNLDFDLVIAFDDEDGVAHRYTLNNYLELAELPIYTNQRINKTFYVEVWSNNLVAISAIPLTFLTSVKNSIDYRFGLDSALATSSTIDTSLYCQDDGDGNFIFPLTFNQDQ